MKSFTHILLAALMLCSYDALAASPLSGTAGSNLTAYNPGFGAINNNEWNSAMNGRSGASAVATADFGNCNSLILRCASPKCGNGGCTSIDVATPIVAGCIASNTSCKQYGDELIGYIAAQLVASSTAKTSAQMAAEQSAANAAAAEQNAQQLQQMQMQMQQMQQQMADQNAAQIAQLQSALMEQQRTTENALAQAAAASSETSAMTNMVTGDMLSSGAVPSTVMEGLTEAQHIAANAGVSADILAREQIAGQIMTSLERAQVNLNKAKAAMQNAFAYAGCTTSGDNCVGPKRASVFRQKAMEFFEPYDAVLDELYDALITAQSVGVDITDIYMMLNGSCNVWGEYLCNGGMVDNYSLIKIGEDAKGNPVYKKDGDNYAYSVTKGWAKYTNENCGSNGKSTSSPTTRGGMTCQVGMVIPPEDSMACTLNRTLTDMEDVQRNFLFAEAGDIDEHVRIGCASSALESSKFFRNRKKGSSIDIETLERIVSQDAPAMFGSNRFGGSSDPAIDGPKYCAVNPSSYMDLQKAAALKKLPSRVCVSDKSLATTFTTKGAVSAADYDKASAHYAPSADGKGMYEDPKYGNTPACTEHQGTINGNNCECQNPRHWVKGNCVLLNG